MSAQLRSRALQEGRVKALRRQKQPMTLVITASPATPDPFALAPTPDPNPPDRMALQALVRRKDWDE